MQNICLECDSNVLLCDNQVVANAFQTVPVSVLACTKPEEESAEMELARQCNRPQKFSWRGYYQIWFLTLCLFVIVVSIHDAGLLILNQQVIAEYEQNPIGAWLIRSNAGTVWLFVVLKLLGTGLAAAILASIYEQSRSTALAVIAVLALLQAMLLFYLYCG